MKLIFILILITFAYACGQKADDTFTKPVYFNSPIYINAGFWINGIFYSTMPTGGVADWNTLLHKPLTFAPDLTITNLLYKPIGYVATYAGLPDKPTEIELGLAISQLPKLFDVKTQTEINALTPVKGAVIINSTDNVMQWFDGVIWRKFATLN